MFNGRLPVSGQGSVTNHYQDLTFGRRWETIIAELSEIPTKDGQFVDRPHDPGGVAVPERLGGGASRLALYWDLRELANTALVAALTALSLSNA